MTPRAVEEGTLETLVGVLARTFPQLKRATILHSDQLTTERRANPELRNREFYTADSALYTVEDGEAILYLGRNETNPIFNNIKKATQQLIQTGNYIPPQEDVEAVKSAESTLRVKISDLMMGEEDYLEEKGEYSSWQDFGIGTARAHYNRLNQIQRALAERVYGQGEDFEQNMKMLRQYGIKVTMIRVLGPNHVKQAVGTLEYVRESLTAKSVQQDSAIQGSAIVRACRLEEVGLRSEFSAVNNDVGRAFGRAGLRGGM